VLSRAGVVLCPRRQQRQAENVAAGCRKGVLSHPGVVVCLRRQQRQVENVAAGWEKAAGP
jgi:hypothetical protein